ncbi:MAG: SH3 domain-containing protein [Candidatus Omnitrophica bacterium]|nr:SH3 domain-containing protein [Candidatus Omnitrophota bacterium]
MLAPAVYSSESYEVTEDNINIRSDATVQSLSLGTLKKGDRIEGLLKRFEWVNVNYPGELTCFVSSEFVKKVSRTKGRVVASKLNIRLKPSLDSPVIGNFVQGQIITINGFEGPWYQVCGVLPVKGWVNEKFLKKIADIPVKEEDRFDLASFMPLLRQPNMKNKEIVHQNIISHGENIVYDLENYLGDEPKYSIYSIIYIFSALAKDNNELLSHFFSRIDLTPVKVSSIYLDVLQNVLKPSKEVKPYYHMALQKDLSREEVINAKNYLYRIYKEKNGDL